MSDETDKKRGALEILTCVKESEFEAARYTPVGVLDKVLETCQTLPRGSVIALHGWPHSGKTPTAIWLARSLVAHVLHLDQINLSDRPGFNDDIDERGFDEEAMRRTIARAVGNNTVVVDGVCAARVCCPDVLVHMGIWPGQTVTSKLKVFIGDYDPYRYSGKNATFSAVFQG